MLGKVLDHLLQLRNIHSRWSALSGPALIEICNCWLGRLHEFHKLRIMLQQLALDKESPLLSQEILKCSRRATSYLSLVKYC